MKAPERSIENGHPGTAEPSLAHALLAARRFLQITWAFAAAVPRFLWLRWQLRGQSDASARALGRTLVHLCSRLGATFIKIGQIVSSRSDLLPASFARELAALQDRVPPFPWATVRTIVETELGRPLAELFAEFSDEPVAAASVAQVHRAVWRDSGEIVAVKVRRPDVLEKIQLDRAVLLFCSRWLERLFPSLRLVSLHMQMAQFCDAVERQVHFENEARNNERFRANFAGDPDISFPRLLREACTDAVLVMEFIDGLQEADLDHAALDRNRIVAAGVRCVGKMVFEHGFVHADLHPGNLRFLPPGRIVLLDLGLVGELTPADRQITAETLLALVQGDGRRVARLFYDNAPFRNVPDYAAYEHEMEQLVGELRGRSLASAEFSRDIAKIFDVLRRHRVQARGHMTMVNLALMTAEGLGKRLDPSLVLAEAALPYLLAGVGGTEARTPDSPLPLHTPFASSESGTQLRG
ncbi:MAG: AarF/UbiB family protein [Candidatus Binatia bacterium]|nr:AarF/UbiB family protein [Candidatus Binatia bacterium]